MPDKEQQNPAAAMEVSREAAEAERLRAEAEAAREAMRQQMEILEEMRRTYAAANLQPNHGE